MSDDDVAPAVEPAVSFSLDASDLLAANANERTVTLRAFVTVGPEDKGDECAITMTRGEYHDALAQLIDLKAAMTRDGTEYCGVAWCCADATIELGPCNLRRHVEGETREARHYVLVGPAHVEMEHG